MTEIRKFLYNLTPWLSGRITHVSSMLTCPPTTIMSPRAHQQHQQCLRTAGPLHGPALPAQLQWWGYRRPSAFPLPEAACAPCHIAACCVHTAAACGADCRNAALLLLSHVKVLDDPAVLQEVFLVHTSSAYHSVVALASSRQSDGYQTCLMNILMVP